MTGTVEDMSIDEARRASHSGQARLSQFGADEQRSTTYIGIVRSDDDQLESVVDEQRTELAPPKELFYQWLNTKKRFVAEKEMSDVQAHNEALSTVDYGQRFGQHLDTDDDARAVLAELADRVRDGEHIVIVCYCGDGKWCHRSLVLDRIEQRLE